MSPTPTHCPDFLERSGFIAARPELVCRKISQIIQSGPERLVAIFDWDHTVIGDSTWRIARSCLPLERQKSLRKFVMSNVDKLDNGTMTLDESRQFTSGMLNVLRDPGLPANTLAMTRTAMASTTLVEGARDVFNRCEQAGVETVIGSASVADFIGITATANGIAPSHIVATPLRFNRGRIETWEEDLMTHDLNKHIVLHDMLAQVTADRPSEVLVGDRPHDTLMARNNNALLIRVGGLNSDAPEYLHESFTPKNHEHRAFDLVAVEPGLMAVDSLFAYMLEQTETTG